MNKEIGEILNFHHKNLGVTPSEIEIKGVVEKSGVSGHQAVVVNYKIHGQEYSLFMKMFNRSDTFYNDIELARSEAYALERTAEVSVLAPRLILFDPKGEIMGKPAIVTSQLEGNILSELLAASKDPEIKEEISRTSFSSMQGVMSGTGKINSPDGKFGSIFSSGWIGEVSTFEDFLTRGLYHEFRRMNMLDKNRVFQSTWAEKVFNWTIGALKDSDHPKLQLCHGDLVTKNILGQLNTDGGFNLMGVVDWEYAYWGPAEKDWGDFLASLGVSSDFNHVQNLLSELKQFGIDTKAVAISMVHRWLILLNNENLSAKDRVGILEQINKIILT